MRTFLESNTEGNRFRRVEDMDSSIPHAAWMILRWCDSDLCISDHPYHVYANKRPFSGASIRTCLTSRKLPALRTVSPYLLLDGDSSSLLGGALMQKPSLRSGKNRRERRTQRRGNGRLFGRLGVNQRRIGIR